MTKQERSLSEDSDYQSQIPSRFVSKLSRKQRKIFQEMKRKTQHKHKW